MKHYSESREVDAISRVHGQIDELKDIMVKNIGEFDSMDFSRGSLLDRADLCRSLFIDSATPFRMKSYLSQPEPMSVKYYTPNSRGIKSGLL